VAYGEPLEFTKALATAQDAENRHQQQVPGRDADPTSHPRIRDGAQKADQIKISCVSREFRQGIKAIPSRTPQADTLGHGDWDRLLISPGSPARRRHASW
jgi:hypothetical protein